MACGCKNKGNTQVQPTQTTQSTVQQTSVQTESIKDTIKKTVEKYYYTDKKTNGWVKS